MSDYDYESETPVKRRGSGSVKIAEKKARREGIEFVTVLIEAKVTKPDCTCRKLCMSQFSVVLLKKRLIKCVAYGGKPNNESDTFLISLINRCGVVRHRPKDDKSKAIESSFTYFAMKGNTKIQVCRTAFENLHALSNKSLQRLTTLLNSSKSPIDRRGQHGKQPRKPDEIIIKVKDLI